MPRDYPPPTLQKSFLLSSLQAGIRLDGRGLLESRKVQIRFGRSRSERQKGKEPVRDVGGLDELGEVEVTMGKTRVLAQISATIVKPRDDRPYEGLLLISSELSSMASPSFETSRISETETLLTRLLEKAIRRSEALDREALCIVAGDKVWQIKVTVHFLSDDGALVDAACLAAMTALKHYRKPEVEVVGEEVIVHKPEERAPVPLAIHHTPLCVTFAYFEGNILIIDPSSEELLLSTGSLTVTLNPQRELCVLQKAGGSPLSVEEVMRVVRIGSDRVREMAQEVEERLKEDWEKRREVIEVV